MLLKQMLQLRPHPEPSSMRMPVAVFVASAVVSVAVAGVMPSAVGFMPMVRGVVFVARPSTFVFAPAAVYVLDVIVVVVVVGRHFSSLGSGDRRRNLAAADADWLAHAASVWSPVTTGRGSCFSITLGILARPQFA